MRGLKNLGTDDEVKLQGQQMRICFEKDAIAMASDVTFGKLFLRYALPSFWKKI